MILVTPNSDSLLARMQRRSWVSLKFPEHVVLFQAATLARILDESGFMVESQIPAGQYARLDFLVSRLLSGYPEVAARAQSIMAKLGGARVRFWVGSGSLLVVASRATKAETLPGES